VPVPRNSSVSVDPVRRIPEDDSIVQLPIFDPDEESHHDHESSIPPVLVEVPPPDPMNHVPDRDPVPFSIIIPLPVSLPEPIMSAPVLDN
jgi:hypothetical protein